MTCALCTGAVAPGAPLPLCFTHLLVARDWVDGEFGTTDLLPSPCAACGSRLGVRYPSGWICALCEWRVGEVPAGDLVAPRVDVVYYIRFTGRVKIGTLGNPRARIAALPHEEVLAFERGDRSVEQRRHAQFGATRIAGTEWFRPSEALDAHIAALREGLDDPWARYQLWLSQELALRG